jgi:hypothetical protein
VVGRFHGKNTAEYLGIRVGRNYRLGGCVTDYQFSDMESGDDESGEDVEK